MNNKNPVTREGGRTMITQEQFDKIEAQYGCGYWHVCDDHACACSPTAAVSQGFNPEVYGRLQKQLEEDRCRLEKELAEYDDDYPSRFFRRR